MFTEHLFVFIVTHKKTKHRGWTPVCMLMGSVAGQLSGAAAISHSGLHMGSASPRECGRARCNGEGGADGCRGLGGSGQAA